MTPTPDDNLLLASLSQVLTTRLALAATLVIILVAHYVRSPWRKVPPGPKGLPILGNALQLNNKSWMFESECKQKFEHLMFLNALGQPILVINSIKTAFELFDRRANIYSDRPRHIVADGILCGGLFTALMSYGDVWRRNRRAAHEILTKVVVRDYHPIFSREANLLASTTLDNPHTLDKHIERCAASATMSILYDYPTLENEDDENLQGIHAFIRRVSEASTPGSYLVEMFPWMIHIPERFAKWKRDAMEHYRQHSVMFHRLMETVCDDIAKGSDRPSVCAALLRNASRSGLSKKEIAWLLGTLYTAGSETTVSTLTWWSRAMVSHPEIQKRAQDELDAVVGRSRTPTFADAPNLPYIQAIVKESLRWRPPLPMAVPHSTTEDDWYEGMYIPKGTICLVNLWQCHHDEDAYGPTATHFNPERFLDEHGKLIPGPPITREDGHSSYGFGRRICVGKHAANDALFIDMATLLWAVRFEYGRDENGNEVPVDSKTIVDGGMVFRPLPYPFKLTPRFPEARSILSEEFELMKS